MTVVAEHRCGRTSALAQGLLVAGPMLTLILLITYVRRHELAVDFDHTFWIAGREILRGHSPYLWTQSQIDAGNGFGYSAFTGYVLAPFALIPQGASQYLYTAMSIACIPATLWAVGVSERRLYAFALLLFPVISAWQSGNLTLEVGLVAALAWRYRDRSVLTAAIVGAAVSLKIFVWPLWVWLVATRRYRTAAVSLTITLALNLACFALLGSGTLHEYLKLSHAITSAHEDIGYGLFVTFLRPGATHGLALALAVALAAMLILLCVRTGRRGNDVGAFALAITISLAASPLVWNHYYALLIVPLAIARPKLSVEWLVLLVMWVCGPNPATELESLVAIATTGFVVWRIVVRPTSGGQRAQRSEIVVSQTL